MSHNEEMSQRPGLGVQSGQDGLGEGVADDGQLGYPLGLDEVEQPADVEWRSVAVTTTAAALSAWTWRRRGRCRASVGRRRSCAAGARRCGQPGAVSPGRLAGERSWRRGSRIAEQVVLAPHHAFGQPVVPPVYSRADRRRTAPRARGTDRRRLSRRPPRTVVAQVGTAPSRRRPTASCGSRGSLARRASTRAVNAPWNTTASTSALSHR